jgi:hypothetical protein
VPTLKRIHVNRNVLASNKKHGRNHPGLGVEERGIRKRYGHRVDILHEGRVIASVIHTEEKPMKCGARCWIETEADVRVEVSGNSGSFQEIPGNSGKFREVPGSGGKFREVPS